MLVSSSRICATEDNLPSKTIIETRNTRTRKADTASVEPKEDKKHAVPKTMTRRRKSPETDNSISLKVDAKKTTSGSKRNARNASSSTELDKDEEHRTFKERSPSEDSAFQTSQISTTARPKRGRVEKSLVETTEEHEEEKNKRKRKASKKEEDDDENEMLALSQTSTRASKRAKKSVDESLEVE